MRASSILMAGLALAALVGPAAAAEPPAALTVRIVPMTYREGAERGITLWQPSQHFYVVLTNVSDKPVRLWREWCSWGYFSLSFEVTDPAGQTTVVRKKDRPWTKNYPDWITLPPGDPFVFEVAFDTETWDNPPLPEKGKSRQVRMRAVFEIVPDSDTAEARVWTGKAVSPEEAYTIYR